MKKFNFYYDRTSISKSNFEKAVPSNWQEDVQDGSYSYGYYRAEEIDN